MKQRDRDNIRKASAFEVFICRNPACGPHLVALDPHDEPICEIVVSRVQALQLVKTFQEMLYEKSVNSDDGEV